MDGFDDPLKHVLHVDTIAGGDSGTGSVEAPFRTLAQAERELCPGGTLRLRAGSVFRESLILRAAGVTVESYGAGPAPRLSGGFLVPPGTGVWREEERPPPQPLDRQDFAANSFRGDWNQVAGMPDPVRLWQGRRSWRFAPSDGDMQANRYLGGHYAEFTGQVRIDGESRATPGRKARLAGFEGSAWHAADGVFMWIERLGRDFRIGLGRGLAITAATTVRAGTWIGFRFVITCGGGPGADHARLHLNDGAETVHRLDRLSLGSELGLCGFGLSAFDATAFAANFADVATWLTDSRPERVGLWRFGGVPVEPLVVTLDGQSGRRCFATAQIAAVGDFCWDAIGQRLCLGANGDPGMLWSEIEYAAREHPLQVLASGVVLRGLEISHHNLDDRTLGLLTGEKAATLSTAGLMLRHHGLGAVDHALRPGRQDSPWNRRLDRRTRYHPAPSGLSRLPLVLSGWLDPPISTAIYAAQADDPLVEVLYNPEVWLEVQARHWVRAGNGATAEAAIQAKARPDFPAGPDAGWSRYVYQTAREPGWWLPSPPIFEPAPSTAPGIARRIRCPRGVVPPPDSDGYLAVFQPDGSVFEAYCPVVLSDGRIICFSYAVTEAGGLLTGQEGGSCASLIPCYAGVIRDGEIADGVISHAMALYLPEAQLAKAARWPALGWDRTNRYRGRLPMGVRLAIPFDWDPDQGGLTTEAGRVIARAAREHGFIAVDRNGGHGLVVKAQHNVARDAAVLNTADAAVMRDLSWITARLQVVEL